MVEQYDQRVQSNIVLDIGDDIGALIIYTPQKFHGYQIDVSLQGATTTKRVHTDVLERRILGQPVFAAVFASLPEGVYTTWSDPAVTFTVVGGSIAELNWCNTDIYVPPVSFMKDERREQYNGSTSTAMLPPRYQNGQKVSSAPMGTAPMQYTDSGQVAWNDMWTNFCDLALACGPPHRDTPLVPVSPDEVQADIIGYERVLAEIERGLRLVTGLPMLRSQQLGWIGLGCADEAMASWLVRAITVENVCVRREGTVLYVPAGPNFRLEKEIKNVITVVAKTHHYWLEHLNQV